MRGLRGFPDRFDVPVGTMLPACSPDCDVSPEVR